MKKNKIAVLGAGNGGQALATHLSLKGFEVSLWDRKKEKISILKKIPVFTVVDKINGSIRPRLITNNIAEAIFDASIIMIVVPANAHRELAELIAPHLQKGQIVLLNPGRTLGALEIKRILSKKCKHKIFVAEAQSLVYACRIIKPGTIRIIGIKETVPVSAFPACDNEIVIENVKALFDSFTLADDILCTGLENIGAILHPLITLLNANKIALSEKFFFYHNLSPKIIHCIEELDSERIDLGREFGKELTSVKDWICKAYTDIVGDSLYERIISNPAYADIEAPHELCTRLILEDVPTGLVPFFDLGRIVGLDMPISLSIIKLCSVLCRKDFLKSGRTLKNLGLDDLTKLQIVNIIKKGNQS